MNVRLPTSLYQLLIHVYCRVNVKALSIGEAKTHQKYQKALTLGAQKLRLNCQLQHFKL